MIRPLTTCWISSASMRRRRRTSPTEIRRRPRTEGPLLRRRDVPELDARGDADDGIFPVANLRQDDVAIALTVLVELDDPVEPLHLEPPERLLHLRRGGLTRRLERFRDDVHG